MGHSQHLRAGEIRGIIHLVGDLRELGRDPTQWRSHLCEQLSRLVNATAAFSFEQVYPHGPLAPPPILVERGLEPGARAIFYNYLAAEGPANDPTWHGIRRQPNSSLTLRRQDMLTDAEWFGSPLVSDVRRAANCNHFLHSQRLLPRHGIWDAITLHRPWASRPFAVRHRRLVHLFHDELARLWNRRPASWPTPLAVGGLAPRVQRAFHRLVVGDTEKQAAVHLHVSPQTFHTYVKILYQQLQVTSRSELLVRYTPGYDFIPRLTPASTTRPSASPASINRP